MLIPLRHGLLPYPNIIAQPPPATAVQTETERLAQAAFSYENHQIDAACQVEVHPASVQQILMRVVREVAEPGDEGESVVA